jgi:uncharacterized protein YyaL (SSP411 family)
MTNRLSSETSPYLLQHKDNPVDWYPWGEEALARARTEDKPILLSIGYAACHWCHVMEHESFEDETTAALMNENFVCIKVDREERPDLDAIYMEAVQTMTGGGGWPMTVFLSPDGTPFYGGTYFPPEERHGLPSFRKVLVAVAETWRDKRAEVEAQGARLVESIGMEAKLRASGEPLTDAVLQDAFRGLRTTFDPQLGGFGSAPKFPQPMVVDLLLRLARRGNGEAGAMARLTLDAMASGGMFDQIGGGFHRYSVDRFWVVPHFEKMLYDNAQLLRTYARSARDTGSDLHRWVAFQTAEWMLAEMRDPAGGFYSTIDADSEGHEGKFYVWSLDEVRAGLGAEAEAAIQALGMTKEGNFEGRNIPVRARETDTDVLERLRSALKRYRSTSRIPPGTDTKVLAAWNGLAASALAEAGTLMDRPEWVEAAKEAVDFVFDALLIEGRLMRSYRDGVVKHLGYCEDYALVIESCVSLYETTFDTRWINRAKEMAEDVIRLFHDDAAGGFFSTGTDAPALVKRPKEFQDNAVPSANSVLALELQKIAHFTGDFRYETVAAGTMRLMRDWMQRAPLGFGHMLGALDFYTGDPLEIIIVGDDTDAGTRALLGRVRDRWRPNKVLVVSATPERDAKSIPLLEGRERTEGRATAYVCRNGVCKLPVSDPKELELQLTGA